MKYKITMGDKDFIIFNHYYPNFKNSQILEVERILQEFCHINNIKLEDCFGFSIYGNLLRSVVYNTNNPKEESNIKDKIKVYIKEPNMPEYIQLLDKFDKKEVTSWLANKIPKYNSISHSILVNNHVAILTIRYNSYSVDIVFRLEY